MQVRYIQEWPKWNKKKHDELVNAVHFFGKQLLSHQMARHIDIELKCDGEMKEMGTCNSDDHWSNPRFFTIAINPKFTMQHPAAVLAHEMVHLKQFAKAELRQKNNILWWKDLPPYSVDAIAKLPLHETENLPWEWEAYSREQELYDLWRKR